jgi:hypothetical protein
MNEWLVSFSGFSINQKLDIRLIPNFLTFRGTEK